MLQSEAYNALTPEYLNNVWGLDINNAADRSLLTTQIRQPQVIARLSRAQLKFL